VTEPEMEINEEFVSSPSSFDELVKLFEKKGDPDIAFQLNDNVHLVSYDIGRIDIRPNARVPKNLASRMSTELKKWTGKSWVISLSNEIGDTTLYEKDVVEQQALKNMIMKDEIIKSVLSSFEGASITDIRKIKDDYLMQADPEDLEFLISADEFGINDTD
jgi:DNA polymerase-3 subunit gamma/tau